MNRVRNGEIFNQFDLTPVVSLEPYVARWPLIAIKDPESCMNDNSQSDQSTIWIIDVCAFFFENFYCITVLIFSKKN